MNLFTGEAADAFFGGDVPPAVRSLLHQAAEAGTDRRGALLWTAQALAPDCLAVYYALYKHHAGRREFELAERAARRGLAEAALQAELPTYGEDAWQTVTADCGIDFRANGPARFWLFTLKALAFIRLRSGRLAEARALLLKIEQLEPDARIGNEVIGSLLDAAGKQG